MSTTHPSRAEAEPARTPVCVEASGTSPDEAMATLPGIYGGKHWRSTTTDRPYSYRYVAVGDDALTLRRSRLDGFLRGEVHIGGDYVVHWLTAGSVVLDTLGDPVALTAFRPSLSPEGERFVFEATDFDARLVHLDRDLVHDVAGELLGATVRSLRFDVRAQPDAASLARWRDAMAATTALIAAPRTPSVPGPEPLAWHRATRAAAAAFLGLYPPQGDPVHPALLFPRNARIRAAVDFVHAHVSEPLTVGQIAEAAGLSIRSTQESFQRVLGMTPIRYVQELRLERVHADLVAADPGTTDVASVARRWGFLHPGRFSGGYRERFGEFPRDTLRR